MNGKKREKREKREGNVREGKERERERENERKNEGEREREREREKKKEKEIEKQRQSDIINDFAYLYSSSTDAASFQKNSGVSTKFEYKQR